MKEIKLSIFVLFFALFLIFLSFPMNLPTDYQFREALNSVSQNDVIIIFNSGGWGNTPLEEADDFSPIIEGIQNTLDDWGYSSIVVPYQRTKNNFLDKVVGAREFLNSFQEQSKKLAEEIEYFLRNNPGKKIIITGLSNGAILAEGTMEKISDKTKVQVFAIEVGVPFWKKTKNSENILHLNNNGKDSLSEGKAGNLFLALFRAPFKWFLAKVSNTDLSFSRALEVSGHQYPWDSPTVGPQIVSFLEEKFITAGF